MTAQPIAKHVYASCILRSVIAIVALCGGVSNASAHAVLDVPKAAVGAPYKATMKIGHGCQGSPTTKVIIQIPEGVIGVKPMPKPGWTLATVKGPYAKAYTFYHGRTLTEGVREISWSGGPLLDEHYDEFVFSAFIADSFAPNTKLHFPTFQVCEKGENRWVEIPDGGPHDHHLKAPAPGLLLIEANQPK
jgi:periplasmic copper chaperone A